MKRTVPIRLAIDMFVLGQGIKTGVFRVCDELLPRLAMESHFRPRYVLPPEFKDAALEYIESRKLPGILYDYSYETPSQDVDIILSPYNSFTDVWREDKKILRAQIVYDLIPILRPNFFSNHAVENFRLIIDNIDSTTLVFTISESTKIDLLEYRPDLSPEKITVIPLAASHTFHPCYEEESRVGMRRRYGIPQDSPYILSLATLEIRKNLHQTIKAFIHFLEANPESPAYIVLSGMQGWKLEQLKYELNKAGKWRDRIIITGFVEENDLPLLYSDAKCFVYMSFYEGFGLPVLEAMACGVPVICSDNSSLPEVVGKAGIMLNADDTDGIAEAMACLLKDSELSNRLSQKGLEQAKKFTWERCAQKVSETLCSAHDSYELKSSKIFFTPGGIQTSGYPERKSLVQASYGWIRSIHIPELRIMHLIIILFLFAAVIYAGSISIWPLSLKNVVFGMGIGAGAIVFGLLLVKKIQSA